jgi:hypothetical protein
MSEFEDQARRAVERKQEESQRLAEQEHMARSVVTEDARLGYFQNVVETNLHAMAEGYESRVGLLTTIDLSDLTGVRPTISFNDVEQALADKATDYELDPEPFRH